MKPNLSEIIWLCNKSISAFNDNTGEIGEYSIIFGDKDKKDFHGNWFTPNTFMGYPEQMSKSIGLINHRVPMFKKGQFDPATEKALKSITDMRTKNAVENKVDEIGVFSKLVLDLSDKYEKMVYDLAKKGVFKWSSGTAPQTYKALDTGELEMFVPVERSLTPIPAEYRMLEHRVMPLKAYTDFLVHDTNQVKSVPAQLYRFLKGYSPAVSTFIKGGAGSGNFGHQGRPGEIGGSSDSRQRGTWGEQPSYTGKQQRYIDKVMKQPGGLAGRPSVMNSSGDLLAFAKENNLHVTYTNTRYPSKQMQRYLDDPNASAFKLASNQTGKTVATVHPNRDGGTFEISWR